MLKAIAFGWMWCLEMETIELAFTPAGEMVNGCLGVLGVELHLLQQIGRD